MKRVILILTILILALALFGGVPTNAKKVERISLAKKNAIENITELQEIDEKVRNAQTLTGFEQFSSYKGEPLIINNSKVILELDFTYLEDKQFTIINTYVNYYDFQAEIELNGQAIKGEIRPSGFLKYDCIFTIPEYTGNAKITYGTKYWSKKKQVFISDSQGLNNILLAKIGEIIL